MRRRLHVIQSIGALWDEIARKTKADDLFKDFKSKQHIMYTLQSSQDNYNLHQLRSIFTPKSVQSRVVRDKVQDPLLRSHQIQSCEVDSMLRISPYNIAFELSDLTPDLI